MKTTNFYLICVLCVLAFAFSSCCKKGTCKKDGTVVAALSAENMKKIIRAEVNAKADKVVDFINLAQNVIDKSRAEKGNISYTLYQDPTDKTKFIFFEEWKDQNAIDFHFATAHFKAFGSALGECTSSAPVITIYDVASQK